METDSIEALVKCLEHIADHPDRFRDVVPVGQELTFMAGLGVGLRFAFDVANDPRERQLRHVAAETRGWSTDSHPHKQMLDRGFSADELLSELARLEGEFIKLASKLA